jgi:hypothetical protein
MHTLQKVQSTSGYAPNHRVSISILGTRPGFCPPTTHHHDTWIFQGQPPGFVIDE